MDFSEENGTEGITIVYRGSEWTPDRKIQYCSFVAHGNHKGFAGRAEFETTGEGVTHFVEEINAFVDSLSGRAALICGVGSDVIFQLELSWCDWSGHALLECKLREEYQGNYYQSTQMYLIIEYAQVVEIGRLFTSTLSEQSPF